MTNPAPELHPGAKVAPAPKAAQSASNPSAIARLRQWLIDSYRGLYKIVLEPSMPTKGQVFLIIFGAILGLIWAWGIYPAEFTGANPNRLNQSAQDQWVMMVAIASSPDPLISYGSDAASSLMSRVPDPIATINRLLADPNLGSNERQSLQALLNQLPANLAGAAAPVQGGFIQSIVQIVILIVLITIITPICVLLWRILIQPNIAAPIVDRIKRMRNKEYAAEKRRQDQELAIQRQQRAMVDQMKKEVATEVAELGEPVMQKLAIYAEGRTFDESYEIELPIEKGGDFLGQCGTVLAEAVDPDPVAIEVWLFDMFSQQEQKKIYVTEAGYNDPSIRGRLEAAVGGAVNVLVAKAGSSLTLESDKIRLQAKLSTVDMNDRGRFSNFNLQMRAWQKSAGAAPIRMSAPAASFDMAPEIPPAKALPDYSDFEFDPPPAMPSQSAPAPQQSGLGGLQGLQPLPPAQTSASGGLRPLQPPPLQMPPSGLSTPNDDDPFGGTGDFTPLSNR